MKYIITTLVFLMLTGFYLHWNNKRMAELDTYWQKQQELCQAVGWYSETGAKEDCQPVEYVRNYLEVE